MKATISIPAGEIKAMLIDHLQKQGYKVESLAFILAEEGYRAGDMYKIFGGVNIVVDLPNQPTPPPCRG